MTVLVAFTRRLRGQGHQNDKRFLQDLHRADPSISFRNRLAKWATSLIHHRDPSALVGIDRQWGILDPYPPGIPWLYWCILPHDPTPRGD